MFDIEDDSIGAKYGALSGASCINKSKDAYFNGAKISFKETRSSLGGLII